MVSIAVSVMTAEQLELWRKLAERFQTLSPPLERGYDRTVQRMIQPVVNVDALDCRQALVESSLDLSGTAGVFIPAALVPANEWWNVHWIYAKLRTTANRWLVVSSESVGTIILASSVVTEINEAIPLHLGPGMSVGMLANNDAGDTAINFNFSYTAWPSVNYPT